MWNSFQKKLAVRAGTSIALGSTIFSVLLSFTFFHRTYNAELQAADTRITQLVKTVEYSTAIATYLDNTELAKEISRGLISNNIVSALTISSLNGMHVTSGNPFIATHPSNRSFPLMSPFITTERVGEITIHPNQKLIEDTARKAAIFNVFILSILSLTLVALAIFLAHYQLARPLKYLAGTLHKIHPGSAQRLKSIRNHSHDEIGQLVNDTNQLLSSAQITLETERSLRAEIELLEKQFRLIFEKASGGIVLTDQQGVIQMFNPSFTRLTKASDIDRKNNFKEKNLANFFSNPATVLDALHKCIEVPGLALDIKLRNIDGSGTRWLHGLFSPVSDEHDQILIECILYDVSERAQREKQARVDAEHDPLTGLLNRRACERNIQKILHTAEQENYKIGVFLIDLDNFKPINDTIGHEAGDHVLKEVAARLLNNVRNNDDLVVRWGGDEFVIVTAEKNRKLSLELEAQRILDRLAVEIDLGYGQSAKIGASIGISIFPDHSQNLIELVKLADSAMYQAKKQGRNRYILYSPTGEF